MSGIIAIITRVAMPAPVQAAWCVLCRLSRAVPRRVWVSIAIAAALVALAVFGCQWHRRQVAAAFTAGSDAQAAADWTGYRAETDRAAAAQHELAVALAARQQLVSRGTADALTARHDDLARRYDDLRLRWAAHKATARPAGDGRAAALPGSAPKADDTACAALGWVAFDSAAAAAHAADQAIAKDDAWIAWVKAQAAAWPGLSPGD